MNNSLGEIDCPQCGGFRVHHDACPHKRARGDGIAPDELKICIRCGRKAGFERDMGADNEAERWVSDCCGWPAVDPTREPDA